MKRETIDPALPDIRSDNYTISRILFCLMIFLSLFAPSKAATITLTTNTNWSAITTGTGPAGQPSSIDDIIVRNQAILTINVATGVCKSITLGGGGNNNNGNLTFNASSQITVSGNIILAAINNRSNDIIMTAGGNLICQGFTTISGTSGSFIPGTGTVQLVAANTLPSIIFTSFNNLIINGGNTTLGTSIAIGGNLTMTSGKLIIGSNTLTLNGNVTSMTAANCLTGSSASNLSIGGTGSLNTLFF